MLPSASMGNPDGPGVFEPCHGSAPDIAGQDKANPLVRQCGKTRKATGGGGSRRDTCVLGSLCYAVLCCKGYGTERELDIYDTWGFRTL